MRRQEAEKERQQKIKDMMITFNPDTEDKDMDEEDQEFIMEYTRQRMMEMQAKFSAKSAGVSFGKVIIATLWILVIYFYFTIQ